MKNINAFFAYNVEFRVSKLQTDFLRILFLLVKLFCSHDYLFELIFALLTLADKGLRVLAEFFLRPKNPEAPAKFPWVQN